ncbi:ComF family protein [Anaerococcus sp. DFU013_CI05]|uniref:ComF family protein n=1 Tax=Anaerococcus sp. AH8042_DFU013_CI05 TaxID=3385202 RepID=UPI003A520D75
MIDFLFLDKNICYNCKRNESVAHFLCKDCLKKLDYVANKFSIENYNCHAVYFYNEVMKKLVADYKFNRNTSLAKVFSSIVYDYARINNLFDCDYILPSPSSKSTLNNRGFDHIKMITDHFIDDVACEYLMDFRKIKNTQAQHNLGKEDRALNLIDAFSIEQDLTEKSVLLIDDLITTGNTAMEIIKVLEKNNVKEVIVLAITSERRIN